MPVGGRKVLVVSGGMAGVETAEYLVHRGNMVTIVKRQPVFAPEMERLNRFAVLESLQKAGVRTLSGKEALGVVEGGATAIDLATGEREIIEAEVVVFALGAKPDSTLADALEVQVRELYTIGDCNEPRITMEAILSTKGPWLGGDSSS